MANEKSANELSKFTWEGTDRLGNKVSGELNAASLAMAKAQLRQKGILPKRIKKQSKPLFTKKRSKKITQGDITIFSRQLATMIASGIPLVQAFDIVAKGQEKENLEKLILEIKTDVETGTTLAQSLKKYPKFFNPLFCNLVDAGERSGQLDIMLDKIATYKEKIESIKGKIKKALFYPTAVLAVAFIVTAALLIFVVPQFEALFKGFGADLPALTSLVVKLSRAFQSYWWLIFGSISLVIYALVQTHQRSESFANWLDRSLLQLPVLGNILKKAAIARFSRTLSITFAAGLPLVDALTAVAGATGNSLFAKGTEQIREEVSSGQQMQSALEKTQLFPNMVVQMIAIGEESGTLESMLSKVADFYEEEVDNAVDALSSLLEPLIMSILGVLVGGLVIAMYLPIFKLGGVV